MGVGRQAKKVSITVVGFALVALGFVLMVAPGPGLLVSVAGFAVLATEYAWAHRALIVTKKKAEEGQRKAARNRLTYVGQLLSGLVLLGVAIAYMIDPELPFGSRFTSVMLVFGGVALITSAVLARRKYAGDISPLKDDVRQ